MLRYYPNRGDILICDYTGFKQPEMTKIRPVIVISPRFRSRANLCTVIPLSTTPPNPCEEYHFQLNLERKLPQPFESRTPWVKSDMINSVSLERLSLIRCGKGPNGERKYYRAKISDNELSTLEEKIKKSIGIK